MLIAGIIDEDKKAKNDNLFKVLHANKNKKLDLQTIVASNKQSLNRVESEK